MQGIDVLYDHYKETFKLSKDAQAQRNRCFVILCFLEAISFLMIIQSDAAISVLSGMVIKYSESHIVLGYRNWQAYEIDKNHEKNNGLVVVKLNSSYTAPIEAYGIGAKWVNSFNLDDILTALNELVK